jgi:hypothetical protein
MKAVALDHRYATSNTATDDRTSTEQGSLTSMAKDKSGRTPLLHSVVQYMSEAGGIISHPEVVKLLLERGADINASDAQGDNALITTRRCLARIDRDCATAFVEGNQCQRTEQEGHNGADDSGGKGKAGRRRAIAGEGR